MQLINLDITLWQI